MLAKFFDLFWGWADYRPKDWSNAPYKRGYADSPKAQNSSRTPTAGPAEVTASPKRIGPNREESGPVRHR
jgi:hypothetical protein